MVARKTALSHTEPSVPHSCVTCINCDNHVTHMGVLNYKSVTMQSVKESELSKWTALKQKVVALAGRWKA